MDRGAVLVEVELKDNVRVGSKGGGCMATVHREMVVGWSGETG